MKKSLRSKKIKLYSCPLDKQMNYKVLYRKEDDEHNTEEIQEEILVPNDQENTLDNTTDTNERDVPQVADEVILYGTS